MSKASNSAGTDGNIGSKNLELSKSGVGVDCPISTVEVNGKTEIILPPEIRAYCHRCEKGFYSLEDFQVHAKEQHDYRKIRPL